MKRSELESSCYLVDGCVTFVCGIIDLNGNDRVPVPPTDLVDHLGHLLECTDGSDVSFSVGGETFCAHRAILAARSPVFKAQLFGSMADAQMDRITLHDVQPAAFRILLRFLYTDALPSDTELVKDLESSSAIDLLQHLLAAADMYQLDRLKLMCAQKLWDRVSPETVAAMLVSAEMHNCPELKKRCIDFFVEKNFRSAALTEGYLRLMQGFPSVIDEIRATLVQP
jgi:speckle-type POZ protein